MQRTVGEIYNAIHILSARTSWEKGVIRYADELLKAYLDSKGLNLKDIHVRIGKISEADLLRGAESWQQYSAMGRALIWDRDICLRLGTKYRAWSEAALVGRHLGRAPGEGARRGGANRGRRRELEG